MVVAQLVWSGGFQHQRSAVRMQPPANLKNGPTPASFSFIFRFFQTINTILTTNQCEKMACPSIIWRWDLNPRPLEHEFSPITTRPGLPPATGKFYFTINCIGKTKIKKKDAGNGPIKKTSRRLVLSSRTF